MKHSFSSYFRHSTLVLVAGLGVFSLINLTSCRDSLSPNTKDPVDTTKVDTGTSTWSQIPAGLQYSIQALHASGNSTTAQYVDGVGFGGMIISSSDGGATWVQQNSGTTENLYDISYSGSFGIAVGNNATMLLTTDHGATWSPISTGVLKPDENLRKIVVYDMKYIYAIGGFAGQNGVAIFSTNNGQTWQRALDGQSNALYGIHVWDPMNFEVSGLKSGQAVFFHTTDWGVTWATQTLPGYILDEAYNANGVGLAVGNYGSMFRKLPGATWSQISAPTSEDIRHVEFISANEAYAVGANNVVLHSTDAGQTWSSETVSPSSIWNSMAVLSANKQILAGDGGVLLLHTK